MARKRLRGIFRTVLATAAVAAASGATKEQILAELASLGYQELQRRAIDAGVPIYLPRPTMEQQVAEKEAAAA